MNLVPSVSTSPVKAGGVDLLAGLVLGGVGTHMAARSPNLRWTFQGRDSPFLDFRFGALLAGVAGWLLGSGGVARASYTLANAAGHSFINTEMVRRQALANLNAGGMQQLPGAQPGQLPAPATAQVQGAPAAFAGVGGFGLPGQFR